MDGGAIAKNAYRYQDWCAMYFTLHSFKNDPSFEHVYCEQDKLDFEIWNTSKFTGFQVKTNPHNLAAKEINKIFQYYSNKSNNSGKTRKAFYFVFSEQPKNALCNTLILVRDGQNGNRYGKRIQSFMDIALKNIPIGMFSIDFYCFDKNLIESLVFYLSKQILEEKVGRTKNLSVQDIHNFISRLRDEIDSVSCRPEELKRSYSIVDIQDFITLFINSTRRETKLEDMGKKEVIIELPKIATKQSVRQPSQIPEITINKKDGGKTQ